MEIKMTRKELTGKLIIECEGIELVAKKDKFGVVNIGVGLARKYLDGSPIIEGDVCTEEQALEWLQEYCEKNVYPLVNSWTDDLKITDRLYASCCAFTYNIGHLGAIIIKALNDGDMQDLKTAFLQYDKVRNSDGELEFCSGLKNRRMKEINFFMDEDGSLK
jgi:lysozyme